MKVSNMFGYGEVNAYSRYSTLMSAYRRIDNPKFQTLYFKRKTRCISCIKKFFQKEDTA